jgi:DNA-binding transcriptional LysR family regulator
MEAATAQRTIDTARLAEPAINPRLLDIFLLVAHEGSMKAVADRVNLSQAAISQSITALEQALGFELLDRTVRPPAVTLDGARVLRYAEEIATKLRECEDAMRAGAKRPYPRVRIGMINSFAALAGAGVLGELRHLADEWSVVSGPEFTRLQALAERRSDIIVSTDDAPVPEGVEVLPIFQEPLVAAVPASYPKQVHDVRRVAAELDFIRFGHDALMAPKVTAYMAQLGVTPTRRYHFDTPDAALNMVAAGLGWAMVTPLVCLRSRIEPASVRLIELKPEVGRRIYVAHRKSDRSDMAAHIRTAALRAWKQSILPQMKAAYPRYVSRIALLGQP